MLLPLLLCGVGIAFPPTIPREKHDLKSHVRLGPEARTGNKGHVRDPALNEVLYKQSSFLGNRASCSNSYSSLTIACNVSIPFENRTSCDFTSQLIPTDEPVRRVPVRTRNVTIPFSTPQELNSCLNETRIELITDYRQGAKLLF